MTEIADFVPNPEAFVLIGEVGLVLLVLEAGVDIDLSTLKLVGTRGFMIAVLGSLLPIAIGMLLAWAMNVGDTKAIITAGAVFGPTSLGIALNILKGGGILNTYVFYFQDMNMNVFVFPADCVYPGHVRTVVMNANRSNYLPSNPTPFDF